ncbi:phenazine biosynthesis protein-like protein phzf family [Xylogone sp. PMI_703]|nr:phenazine biosynthesis protein-like protein phzf family [Xylogone sp. PMI_703]
MKLSFTTLDVFTTTRYAGNPLAIVRVPAKDKPSLTQDQKQAIAKEFNLSEIVFLHLPVSEDSDDSFKEVTIDIFTTIAEIPFAGHPTIGSAWYLLNILNKPTEAVITKAGRIPIADDSHTGQVKAEIPQTFHIHQVTYRSELNSTDNPTVSIVKGMSFVLVEVPDLDTLAKAKVNLSPDTFDPSPLDKGWDVGLTATIYRAPQGVDEFGRKKYRTRTFAHVEDPGTGSASCALGCWLALQEPKSAGQGPFKFAFTQGVEMGRPNYISVEVTRDESGEGIQKVVLSGAGVKVMEGSLEI